MNSDSNRLALKSGVWYVLGNFLTKAAGFITTPIFTRILTVGEVGAFSNLLSWVDVLIIITTLNLPSAISIARFDYRNSLNKFICSNLVLGSIWTFLVYFLCSVFKEEFLFFTGFSELEFEIVFFYLLVYPAFQMFLINARINYKYKTAVALSLISASVSTFLSLFCVLLFQNKLLGRELGYFLPLIFLNLIIYSYFIVKGKSFSFAYCLYALRVSIPLVWHSLAGNVLGSSDKVMIRYFCGNDAVALYSIAYYCALILSVFWTAINNAWSPWAYEKMHEGNIIELKKNSRPLISMMFFVVFIFLLFAPELLFIMGGEKYFYAINVIPPVMISCVFQAIYSLYVNIEFYHKKQSFIAVGTAIAAFINIVLNYIFIPVFGYVAAAYTTLVGYAVLFFVHFGFVKHMHKDNWYDTRFNFSILYLSVILMVLMLLVYKAPLLRYFLMAVTIGGVFVFLIYIRKEIPIMVKTKSISSIYKKIFFKKRRKEHR